MIVCGGEAVSGLGGILLWSCIVDSQELACMCSIKNPMAGSVYNQACF
jgi:hypothetical protein